MSEKCPKCGNLVGSHEELCPECNHVVNPKFSPKGIDLILDNFALEEQRELEKGEEAFNSIQIGFEVDSWIDGIGIRRRFDWGQKDDSE